MSAHSKLMTVKLNISSYDGKKLDKRASQKVEEEFHLTKKNSKAGEYKANLFLGADEELLACHRAINALRAYHYSNTFRWEPNEQLLACKHFQEYYEFCSRMKALIEQRVGEFADRYQERVKEALSNRGGLANEADYPTKEEMLSKFSVSIQFNPLPTGKDLRLEIPEERLEELQKETDARLEAKLKDATEDMLERFKTLLSNAKDQLFKTPDTGRYHASWQQNLGEFVKAARGLNLTKNEELEKLFDAAEELCSEDPDTYKENLGERSEAATEAQRIYEQMLSVFGGPQGSN